MAIKVTRIGEVFVTLLAVMGFLTSVDLHVLLQLPRSLEGFRTLNARIWFLFTVD